MVNLILRMHTHYLFSHIHLNTCNGATQANSNCMQRCTLKSHANMHPRIKYIYVQQCHTGYIPTYIQWCKTCKFRSACNGAIKANSSNHLHQCTPKNSNNNMHPRLYKSTCNSAIHAIFRPAYNGATHANSDSHATVQHMQIHIGMQRCNTGKFLNHRYLCIYHISSEFEIGQDICYSMVKP